MTGLFVTYHTPVSMGYRWGKGQPHLLCLCSRVSLPEEPPTAPPQNVIASGRTNQSIMIQWQPPPESHQNGILKGYIIRYRPTLGPGGGGGGGGTLP